MECELKNDVIYIKGTPLNSDSPDLYINIFDKDGYIIRQFNIYI